MEVTFLGLITKIGYVAVVGATSIMATTSLTYYHNHNGKSKIKSRTSTPRVSKEERLEKLRSMSEAE